MSESTNTYNDAQAYERILKDPTLALRTMRMYYEKGEKIALLHAFRILTNFYRNLEDSNQEKSEFLDFRLPRWMEKGINHEIKNSFVKGETAGRGSKANSFKRTQKDQEHLTRYLAVRDVILDAEHNGNQISIPAAVKIALKKDKTISPMVTNRTIENSYKKVDLALSDPATFWRYYPIPDFLEVL